MLLMILIEATSDVIFLQCENLYTFSVIKDRFLLDIAELL